MNSNLLGARVRTVSAAPFIALSVAMLSSCGGAPTRYGTLPITDASRQSTISQDRQTSWVFPDAIRSHQLLFESDIGTASVDVYSLPDLKLEATLTGLEEPTGECSDGHGNVWVADTYLDEMFEYSHQGKQLSTIQNAGPNPQACAVNPSTGELAVMEYSNTGYTEPGEVYVYSKPSASPRILRNPEMLFYAYAVYDSQGRLWIDGNGTFTGTILSRCGRSRCSTVPLHGGSIFSIGSLAWDEQRSTLVVFDDYCHDGPSLCSYPVSYRGALGTPTLYLNYAGGGFCAVGQFALTTIGKESFIAGGDSEYACAGYKDSTVDVWSYPGGGTPQSYRKRVIYPYGATVSI